MVLEKLYPKVINVYKNGQFGVMVSNGVYKSVSGNSKVNSFQTQTDYLTAPRSIMGLDVPVTLVCNDKIDFTGFSTIIFKENGASRTLDVTGYTGEAYLCYRGIVKIFGSSYDAVGAFMLSATKDNFESNVINNLKTADKNFGQNAITITEITIE